MKFVVDGFGVEDGWAIAGDRIVKVASVSVYWTLQ